MMQDSTNGKRIMKIKNEWKSCYLGKKGFNITLHGLDSHFSETKD
jgi:hypothetical protein